MPRYFFNITDGQSYPDNVGTELPSLVAARREAILTFGDIVKNQPEWRSDKWRIDVADAGGETLLTLNVRIDEIHHEAA